MLLHTHLACLVKYVADYQPRILTQRYGVYEQCNVAMCALSLDVSLVLGYACSCYNLLFHTKGRTYAEGVREYSAEEVI